MSMDDTGTDIFDVDDPTPKPRQKVEPLYRIYKGSRIAVGSAIGKMWERRYGGAIKAYEEVTKIWDLVLRYYNNNQNKTIETPRGVFQRGDATENIVYSNLNVMLPAVYSKDPDI